MKTAGDRSRAASTNVERSLLARTARAAAGAARAGGRAAARAAGPDRSAAPAGRARVAAARGRARGGGALAGAGGHGRARRRALTGPGRDGDAGPGRAHAAVLDRNAARPVHAGAPHGDARGLLDHPAPAAHDDLAGRLATRHVLLLLRDLADRRRCVVRDLDAAAPGDGNARVLGRAAMDRDAFAPRFRIHADADARAAARTDVRLRAGAGAHIGVGAAARA